MNKMITLSRATRIAGVATVIFPFVGVCMPSELTRYAMLALTVASALFLGCCDSLDGEDAELFGTSLGHLPSRAIIGIGLMFVAVCVDSFADGSTSDLTMFTMKLLAYLGVGIGVFTLFRGLMSLFPASGKAEKGGRTADNFYPFAFRSGIK